MLIFLRCSEYYSLSKINTNDMFDKQDVKFKSSKNEGTTLFLYFRLFMIY